VTGEGTRWRVNLEGVTLLNRYRVEQQLGEGGMATVYQAQDEHLGLPVVVKVPHVALLAERGFRERFEKEIADLIQLQHPHIVGIQARGDHDEVPFIVLKALSGGSLEDRLAGGKQLSFDTVKRWARDVGSALDFMHGRGVVHRDVKPANILFDEHDYVYLSDFGIAKAIGQPDTQLTMTGATPGSPTYMAPEQSRGTALSGASDQYALSSTLYEALAGRPPFEGENVVDVLLKKQAEDPPNIAELCDVPAPAATAIMRALVREPDGRFESCTAFAEALLAPPSTASPSPSAAAPASAGVTAAQPEVEHQAVEPEVAHQAVEPPEATRPIPVRFEAPAAVRAPAQKLVVPPPSTETTTQKSSRSFQFAFAIPITLILVVGFATFLFVGSGESGNELPPPEAGERDATLGMPPNTDLLALQPEDVVGTYEQNAAALSALRTRSDLPELERLTPSVVKALNRMSLVATVNHDHSYRLQVDAGGRMRKRTLAGTWRIDGMEIIFTAKRVGGRKPEKEDGERRFQMRGDVLFNLEVIPPQFLKKRK